MLRWIFLEPLAGVCSASIMELWCQCTIEHSMLPRTRTEKKTSGLKAMLERQRSSLTRRASSNPKGYDES